MEEIKVGEYIRSYCIFKVVSIDTTKDGKYYRGDIPEWIGAWEEDIKSHSPSIIDLIEVGDYVNGSEVINITEAKRMNSNLSIVKVIEIERDYGMMEEYEPTQVLEHEIESIVTREQFESMKYVVGGKEE